MFKPIVAFILQVGFYCEAFSTAVSSSEMQENSQLWVSVLCQIQRKRTVGREHLILVIPNNNLTNLVDGFLQCADTPLLIFNNDRGLQTPRYYSNKESALILLPDGKIPWLLASLTLLPKNPHIRVWVVFTTEVEIPIVESAFQVLWNAGYVNTLVLRRDFEQIYFYRYFPFSDETCNRTGPPVLLTRWSSGAPIPEDVFRDYQITNFNGCILNCGTFHHPPISFIDTGNIMRTDGNVGNIIHVLSHNLGFKCHLSTPIDGEKWGQTFMNGTSNGLQGEVINNIVDIGFTDYFLSLQRWQMNGMVKVYRDSCLTILLPSGLGLTPNFWSALTDEFSFEMWLFLSVAIAGSALFAGFISKISYSVSVQSFCRSAMYAVITFFGTSARTRPESSALRNFFSMWFLFSMVVWIAYLAAFSSLVTVPWRPTDLDTLVALLKAKLPIYMYPSLVVFVADVDDNSLVAEISKRVVASKTPLGDLVATLPVTRDYAMLYPKEFLVFTMSQMDPSESAQVHLMDDFCVLRTMVSPMITKKGSPLTDTLDKTVQRVIESGLFEYWLRKYGQNKKPHRIRTVEPFSLRNVLSAFLLHAIGVIVSLLILILERIFSPNQRSNN